MPALSVVVAIYNVSDYLIPCLESVMAQTLEDVEVVLIDDGSTDGSGEMAEDFAEGISNWRVVHVENGGLGRARNIGLEWSTADYVAFVDSDDMVPRDAYELMLHAVSESGSDIVSGGVLRFDGARTFKSRLHGRAISRTQMRTHIHETPSLVYDTTAWNKVYRRAFLDSHRLRFPEGVFYEDIPFTVPAHFLASSVDLLDDPVYLWRERQTAMQSITQRRAETKNVVDRMAAVSFVDDFLEARGDRAGKAVHDRKVLTLDMPLFLDVLHEGTPEFRERVLKLAAEYLQRVPPEAIARLPPIRRLEYHLIARGMLAELIEVQAFYRTPANRRRFVRSGLRMYADLPFRTDPQRGIPAELYEVTRTQPLRTGLRDVHWEGAELVVDGHAFIDRVSEGSKLSSVRRFQLRRIGALPDEREPVVAWRTRRPDLTAKTVDAPVSYDWAGFRASVGARQLLLRPGENEARFELLAQVATPSARRGSSVGNPEPSRARHPGRAFVAPAELAVPGYADGGLVVAVRRVGAVLESVEAVGDGVRFTLQWTGPPLESAALFLRRTDSLHAGVFPLQHGGRTATVTVSADDLEIKSSSLGDREWIIGLAKIGQASTAEPTALLDMAPEMEDVFLLLRQRSIVVRQDASGSATVLDTRPGPVLTGFSWETEGLRLWGIANGGTAAALTMTSGTGLRHSLPIHCHGDQWSLLLPAQGRPGGAALRWLKPGRWSWTVSTEETGQRERPVRVSSSGEALLAQMGAVDGLIYRLESSRRHGLQLTVDASGDYKDRGHLHRERARKYHYRLFRSLPVEETILFEAWKGKQYSDNPRAIYEELVRRGDRRRLVWAVSDYSVEVPQGTETVLTGSRDYYRHLARARWLVSNDSMPTHYIKRKRTRYGQTWHGTPLKRIGFDIQNLQMANQNYLVQFGRDVAKWDALVSPNPFSTEILGRAFKFAGEIMEIGYPRNDIFYREAQRSDRTRAAKARLGIEDDRRVLLYAPTWRDNDYSTTGRYQFTMKLDLERMHREFGDDSVLLIRGHQLVVPAIDSDLFGGFVRNVSEYPDISELYLVADVLITDYSSVMFDFANTGRPMLFYTWDLDDYRDNLRGFYFDFEAEAPGPLLRDSSGVVDALNSLEEVAAQYAHRYRAFQHRFTSLEDGGASARFIERFL